MITLTSDNPKDFDTILKYIDQTPELKAMLRDFRLLPSQVEEDMELRNVMMLLACAFNHGWKSAEESQSK